MGKQLIEREAIDIEHTGSDVVETLPPVDNTLKESTGTGEVMTAVEEMPAIKISDTIEMVRGEEFVLVNLHEELYFLDKGWVRCQ